MLVKDYNVEDVCLLDCEDFKGLIMVDGKGNPTGQLWNDKYAHNSVLRNENKLLREKLKEIRG